MTRLLAKIQQAEALPYDFPLPDSVRSITQSITEYVRVHGDPVKGYWPIDFAADWVLFTDSSRYASSAVLQIGGTICEDRAWLREHNCRRHINVSETEAAVKGLDLVVDYIRAYKLKRCSLRLLTDNTSVVSWLNRKSDRHWKQITGLCKNAVEGRVQIIEDVCKYFNIELTVEHVKGEDNLADAPSRIPKPI
ncbi:hypothetical protein FOZ60_001982, partial [Perkinsus olseni]